MKWTYKECTKTELQGDSTMTAEELRTHLDKHFYGQLTAGGHEPSDGYICAIELVNHYYGREWGSWPRVARCFDYRPLNDACWGSAVERTKWMLQVAAAYDGSLDWPVDRQRAVAEQIVVETIRQIVAEYPSLPDWLAAECREVTDWDSAKKAMKAVFLKYFILASVIPAEAAANAANAAKVVQYAAIKYGFPPNVLVRACRIWLDAAVRRA